MSKNCQFKVLSIHRVCIKFTQESNSVLFFTSCSYQDRIIYCMFKKLLVVFHWNVWNTIGTASMKLSMCSRTDVVVVFVLSTFLWKALMVLVFLMSCMCNTTNNCINCFQYMHVLSRNWYNNLFMCIWILGISLVLKMHTCFFLHFNIRNSLYKFLFLKILSSMYM